MQSNQPSWSCVTVNRSQSNKAEGSLRLICIPGQQCSDGRNKALFTQVYPSLLPTHTLHTASHTHTPLSCLLLLYDCCSDFITVFSSSGALWCCSTINRRKFDTSVLLSQVDWQIHSVFNWSELYGTIKATGKCDLAVLVIHELITLYSMSPEANPPTEVHLFYLMSDCDIIL